MMTTQASTAPVVNAASADDQRSVIDTIVLAFATDPMARWCWPDSHAYLKQFPVFVRAFGGAAFGATTAYRTTDGLGAALWLPPDVHADEEALERAVEETIAESTRHDLYGVLEQMGAHHPKERHWYLPMIGVDPNHQGQGYGAALMRYALQRCDREGALAYLESSNPRNITLYERHGFEAIGRIQSGTSPALVPMVRKPA